MRLIDQLTIALSIFTAAGPALSQPAEPQLFSVTTTGPSAVPGRESLTFTGIAFAVGPDTLLTAQGAVGAPAQFGPAVRFARDSVPDRTIKLFGNGGPEFPAGVAVVDGPAAVLVRNPREPPLARARLSACPPGQAGLRLRADGEISVEPVLSGGVVTHYRVTQPGGWDGRGFLGAPALDGEGRVVGMLADVADDGLHVAITPLQAITHLLPQATRLDCDPRVSADDMKDLKDSQEDLDGRIADAEDLLNKISQTMDVVTQGLANVALQPDNANLLKRLSDELMPARPLVGRVSNISTILQRPTWTTKAKIDKGRLLLTFVYRMQLPAPAFSSTVQLCVRILTPYKGDRERDLDQYFRNPGFYAAATSLDPDGPAQCTEIWVNVPDQGNPTDWGQYSAEMRLSDFEGGFEDYVKDKAWIEDGYEWNRVIYVALVRPGADPGAAGGADPQGGMVIQRALIRLPEGGSGTEGALPVECRIFDSDQAVIDFLAKRKLPVSPPDLDNTALDDVADLELDSVNASDECVPSSAP